MFFESPTIGFNGFSMVFEITRAMVNDGLDVPMHKKVGKMNMRQNELMNICWTPNPKRIPNIDFSTNANKFTQISHFALCVAHSQLI